MRNLYGKNNVENRFTINHMPPIISTTSFGFVLFGEDPGNIIDEILHDDQIEKLIQ